ncbi:hypothetical protein GLI01_06930 [Gluconacetobacter liquefaciens]|uniref:TetR family transcriptional regulator n=1 Tax=Gluconacetobacter liquefaciens TaxID=89584 RepID=A0A370G8D7_GLULI|nr:TetR/AcrR family transcriptional regulator [Gluconacetobacter liquefaciens]MBB2186614.1 TetR family transcriptional regulator [Gluconacetobacter liquefaciens]RDI38283.1 TetR family transcriptional regulator [Gluconacetobacter liquefaciens]GEB36658.1 hypothetical protein GLI01_06930 [Gluconacetobacter liquefaciens]
MKEPVALRRIVVEARELFREHGYEGASMRDLAARVGLRPQSLYTRFPAKQALVPDVLALTLEETLADLPDPSVDWRAAWHLLVVRIADTLEQRGRCVGLHLAYGMTAATPEGQVAVRAFFDALRGHMAGILRAGGRETPDDDAADALAQLEGATLWIATHGDRRVLRRARERLLALAGPEKEKGVPGVRRRTVLVAGSLALLGVSLAATGALAAGASHGVPIEAARLVGSWQCSGHFHSGRVHRSTYTGSVILDGAWLQLAETDIEPASGYTALYLLGFDAQRRRDIMFDANNAGAAVYASPEGWYAGVLVLSSDDAGEGAPYRFNRFIYRLLEPSGFSVTWQVKKTPDAEWVTGDELACRSRAG